MDLVRRSVCRPYDGRALRHQQLVKENIPGCPCNGKKWGSEEGPKLCTKRCGPKEAINRRFFCQSSSFKVLASGKLQFFCFFVLSKSKRDF